MSDTISSEEEEELIYSDTPTDLEEVPRSFDEDGFNALVDIEEFLGTDSPRSDEIDEDVPLDFDQERYNVLVDVQQFFASTPQHSDDEVVPGSRLVRNHSFFSIHPTGLQDEAAAPDPDTMPRHMRGTERRRQQGSYADEESDPPTPPEEPPFDMAAELKKLDNYQLPQLIEEELAKAPEPDPYRAEFTTELFFATLSKLKSDVADLKLD